MEDSTSGNRRDERRAKSLDAAGTIPQEIRSVQNERAVGPARRRFPLWHGHRVRPAVHQLSEAVWLHERTPRLVRWGNYPLNLSLWCTSFSVWFGWIYRIQFILQLGEDVMNIFKTVNDGWRVNSVDRVGLIGRVWSHFELIAWLIAWSYATCSSNSSRLPLRFFKKNIWYELADWLNRFTNALPIQLKLTFDWIILG